MFIIVKSIINLKICNMKKLIFLFLITLTAPALYSQTFKSPSAILKESKTKIEMKSRIINLSDKEISITKFIGGVDTQYLTVNKTEQKEYSFDGMCKYYYCTTKDKDPVNGYQKAIVIKTYDQIILAMFATEIDVYVYYFAIQ